LCKREFLYLVLASYRNHLLIQPTNFPIHPFIIHSNYELEPRITRQSQVTVDNIHKRRLQTSTSDQEPIDIRLLAQVLAVLLADTTTIDDSCLFRDLFADLLLQPFSDSSMDFLSLLSASNFTGTDGPNWFICNNDLAPVRNLFLDSLKLRGYNLDSLAALALF
jgi:hypothetical protein